MSKRKSKNLDISVHQRLLNLSRERNEDFNLILTKYAVERFLYRLACSKYVDKFILKGAMLKLMSPAVDRQQDQSTEKIQRTSAICVRLTVILIR